MATRKKIACVMTEYRVPAHADVIIGKFLNGFPTDEGLLPPQVDIVSFYIDQFPENDIGVAVAAENGIEIYRSIKAALCLGGSTCAVDGVICIGEHGEYAENEKGQAMFPRRYFFEQICGVIASSIADGGSPIPVYTDKHLAYNWTDAKWMYDRAQELGIPFMAGSSVPLFWRTPWLEHPLECPIKEALFLSFGSLEGYGYHGLETLQSFVERRAGGEVGLRAVTMLEGEQVWAAGREGRWSSKLLDFAIAHGQQTLVGNRKYTAPTYAVAPGRPEDFDFTSDVRDWVYCAEVEGEGEDGGNSDFVCTVMSSSEANPNPSFSYLGLNIQKLFLDHQPTYPVERTLLVTGALDALMESHYQGHVRIETPHLANIGYQASETEGRVIRPTSPYPIGASITAGLGDSLRKTEAEAIAEREQLRGGTLAEEPKAAMAALKERRQGQPRL